MWYQTWTKKISCTISATTDIVWPCLVASGVLDNTERLVSCLYEVFGYLHLVSWTLAWVTTLYNPNSVIKSCFKFPDHDVRSIFSVNPRLLPCSVFKFILLPLITWPKNDFLLMLTSSSVLWLLWHNPYLCNGYRNDDPQQGSSLLLKYQLHHNCLQ